MSDEHNIEYKECKVVLTEAVRNMKGNIDLNVLIGVMRELTAWFQLQRDMAWANEFRKGEAGFASLPGDAAVDEAIRHESDARLDTRIEEILKGLGDGDKL